MLALAALSLAAAPFEALRPWVAALDVVLAGIAAADLWATPSPAGIAVERRLPARARLGSDFTRVLSIEPGRAGGLFLEVREEFPPSFEVRSRSLSSDAEPTRAEPAAPLPGDPTGGPDTVRLPRGESAVLERVYRPHLRGPHALGDLRLRLRTPLGLFSRQARLAGRQEIPVEPALAGLARTLELAASERWRDLGVRTLRRRGGLTEFESLRPYATGDDVRWIDWKAFARRGEPTVRQYQVERGQELVLCIDCGRRMGATAESGAARGWTKLDFALDAALQLAAVALQEGDRVGVLAFDSAVRAFVPPRRGKGALARLIEAVFDLEPSPLESDLARALRELSVRHRRSAMVVVLSDVADPLSVEDQRRALSRSARRRRVVFAALDDPLLLGAAEGADPPGPAATPLRAAALHLTEERRAALRRLSGAGARVLDPLPSETAGALLGAWLEARRGGLGGGPAARAAARWRAARTELK